MMGKMGKLGKTQPSSLGIGEDGMGNFDGQEEEENKDDGSKEELDVGRRLDDGCREMG